MFKVLPKELISFILYELDYDTLISAYKIEELDKYERLDTILLTRRISCFPRLEGGVKLHSIPESIISRDIPKEDRRLISFEYLVNNKVDLVKGDIIFFEAIADVIGIDYIQSSAIFDGININLIEHRFQPLDYFKAIENSIPLNYWVNLIRYCNPQTVRIDDKILNRCINNITYGKINEYFAIYTKFIRNNIEYIIIKDNYNDYGQFDNDIMDTKTFEILSEDCVLEGIQMFKNDLKECVWFWTESDSIYKSIPNALYYTYYSTID